MKNFTFFATAFAVASILASCQNELENQTDYAGQMVELNVALQGPDIVSKATSIIGSNETKVSKLQVFVLDSQGTVESYKSVSASSLTLSTTTGSKELYALVNSPDCATVKNKTELLAAVSNFSDNSLDSFAMVGSTKKTITSTDANAVIPVKRLVARISIGKITAAFSSPALAAKEFTVKKIYLINVAGDSNYGVSAAPSVWYNKMKYESSSVDSMTYDGGINAVVTSSAPHDVLHTFYCYPNPTANDANAGTWSPRHTRLVIETTLGDKTYYYPITMPVIERNKTYSVTELVVTRPGSDDPDKPVSTEECTYSVSVEEWETGLAPYVETI